MGNKCGYASRVSFNEPNDLLTTVRTKDAKDEWKESYMESLQETSVRLESYLQKMSMLRPDELDEVKEMVHENLYTCITLNQNQLGEVYDTFSDSHFLQCHINDEMMAKWLDTLILIVPMFVDEQFRILVEYWYHKEAAEEEKKHAASTFQLVGGPSKYIETPADKKSKRKFVEDMKAIKEYHSYLNEELTKRLKQLRELLNVVSSTIYLALDTDQSGKVTRSEFMKFFNQYGCAVLRNRLNLDQLLVPLIDS